MSDLVGNPEDRFSRVEAHMLSGSGEEDFFSRSLLFIAMAAILVM